MGYYFEISRFLNLLVTLAVVVVLEGRGFAAALPIKMLQPLLKKKFEHPAVSKHSRAQFISDVLILMRSAADDGRYSVPNAST